MVLSKLCAPLLMQLRLHMRDQAVQALKCSFILTEGQEQIMHMQGCGM
jgi:hypothetical protein